MDVRKGRLDKERKSGGNRVTDTKTYVDSATIKDQVVCLRFAFESSLFWINYKSLIVQYRLCFVPAEHLEIEKPEPNSFIRPIAF
jgi:hypothetical protein